jgi:hypothetical protein
MGNSGLMSRNQKLLDHEGGTKAFRLVPCPLVNRCRRMEVSLACRELLVQEVEASRRRVQCGGPEASLNLPSGSVEHGVLRKMAPARVSPGVE